MLYTRVMLVGRAFGSLLTLGALSCLSHAFVLIDDFTVGNYTKTFNGTGQDTHQEVGLDTAHSAFGDRGTTFFVVNNPRPVPVTLDIGQGRATVFTPPGQNDGISTTLSMELGLSTPTVIDFSAETEFWVDLDVKKPNGRFADQWTIYVRDANGKTGTNDGWLFRTGGIRFRLSGFTNNVDFSKITDLSFFQRFSSPGYPESYTVTSIYAVPEPCSLTFLAILGCLAARKRAARHSG